MFRPRSNSRLFHLSGINISNNLQEDCNNYKNYYLKGIFKRPFDELKKQKALVFPKNFIFFY
jgi:hypothetical protein